MEKYIRLLIVVLLLSSCSKDEDIINPLPPTLELDGRLPMDNNGYYRLELNDSSFQTIHTISGTVGNTLYWDEPMKVEWDSNLSWYLQDEFEVSTANPASYVVDGKVMNVIGPVQTMVGDTLILTGTIREHLVSDTIKFVLE
jgi:hypothetical protein|tara:strand:+ start:219 stop:644 length:426 start_codon:yes stop_codon:yes gene_type:complete